MLLSEEASREVIVKFNGDIFAVGEALSADVEVLSDNFAILTINPEMIPLLREYTEIEGVELPKTLTFNVQESINKSCIRVVQNDGKYNLLGEGVLIAILDSGIDYTHPDFINEDGTSRILYLWDQTIQGNPPSGFLSGSEYTNQQINLAIASNDPYNIVPEIDSFNHGTAVAGVCAGNGRASGGENLGVAPKSSLIVVKLGERGYESFARTTELMRGIKYVSDKAFELRMPVAINISYGTNDGPHNGESLFESYINSIAEKWKTSIVVAAGNEGAAGHHYSGLISSNQTQDVQFFYSGRNNSFYFNVWKNFVDTFSVELILPNGRSTGEITYYDRLREYRIGNVNIVVNYDQPKFYNTFQEIFFEVKPVSDLLPVGIYTLRIVSQNIIYGVYDVYLPTVEEVGNDTAFTFPAVDSTLTIPSTAQNVITVSGYDSVRDIPSEFSGRGYTLNIVYTKPDLAAPAVNILTTSVGGGYSSFSGTSMAPPFVTGSAALLMQWGIVQGNDPFLYGERIKAYLKRGSRRLKNVNYPNNRWGYGALCLYDTLEELWDFNGYI